VRHFNRFYTREIGILEEHLLDSRLSLTEVRLLYELAHRASATAVQLGCELRLDRGYLSRLLQNFQAQGWIKTAPSPSDRRKILLSLTGRGRKVFLPLDRRSSDEVRAMLCRLSSRGQQTLVGAMRQVEEILSRCQSPAPRSAATACTLRPPKPGDLGWVVHRHGVVYADEYGYDERFESLVAKIVAEFVENYDSGRECCWIAEKAGEAVGSVFLVNGSGKVAKLRLLLVEPAARGLGLGERLVNQCIAFARRAGYRKIVLWTQSELHAARHLYQKAGFTLAESKPHRSWGRNDLVAETWELKL
jgi:DNA-binding MarR family transcriptional regulator/GNAT superfamily N-acetyltransferase